MKHFALDLPRRLAAVGRRRAASALALNALAGLTEGIGVLALVPLLKLLGIGDGAAPLDPRFFALVLTGYVLLVGGAALIGRARNLTAQALTLEFLDRLRADLHAAVLNMEWRAFRKRRAADLQQVMTGEIGRIHGAVIALGDLLGAALAMPFLAVAAVILSPALTAAALAVVIVAALATRGLGARGWRLGRELGAANQAAMADLVDNLAGLRLIKIFAAENARAAVLSNRFAAVRDNQRAYQRAQSAERAVLQTVAAAAAAGGLYLAVFVLRLPLAEALTLMLAYGRLLQAALRCLSGWRRLTGSSAALIAYDETLAACRAASEPAASGLHPPSLQKEIRLSGVVVRHGDPDTPPALDHVDAVIPAGKVTALIGPSGAGKSTFVDLVLGLTAPDAGCVTVDGVELSPGLRRAWRGGVSACPQDPFLFHDTLRANLRLARPDADDAALWTALEDAAATDFVRALPHGPDTVAGDRGGRFSGGERQRLALARALLRRPVFLALDEATASLDDQTAAAVATTVDRLRGGTTVLIVAHRLSAVAHADHVLLLEAGRIHAAGTWEEVRAQAGPRLAAIGMIDDA
jgi:ATP-binding cassette, subfamily C, bacterial